VRTRQRDFFFDVFITSLPLAATVLALAGLRGASATVLDAGLTALAATLGCFTAATGTFAATLASLGAGVAILGEALAGFAVTRARAEGAIFGAGLDGFGASAAGLVFFAGLLAALRSGSFGFAWATGGRENGASIASSGGLGRNRVAAPAPKSAAMFI
jgi:hypothetical protein